LGGVWLGGVKPWEFQWPSLFLFASTRKNKWDAGGAGPVYPIVVPPTLRGVERRYRHHWVEITARFEHPYAQQCRGTGPAEYRPSRAQAIRICRASLVLTSIRTIGAPDTATAPGGGGPAPRVPAWSWGLVAAVLGGWAGWRRSRGRTRQRPQ